MVEPVCDQLIYASYDNPVACRQIFPNAKDKEMDDNGEPDPNSTRCKAKEARARRAEIRRQIQMLGEQQEAGDDQQNQHEAAGEES
jgi:hypothetical protein